MRVPTPGKIVQIAVTSGGEDNTVDVVYALDSTGRVFFLGHACKTMEGPRWQELQPLTAENVKNP